MKGYPTTIATADDIRHLLADDMYKTQALAHLQRLMDERYGWLLTAKLADGDAGTTTTGYKVVEIAADGAATERYQYTWGVLEPNGLTRLGITAATAVALGGVDRVIAAPEE